MAILANRVKIKNNLIELGKFTISSLRKFFILVLILASSYLLYFSAGKSIENIIGEITGNILYINDRIYERFADIYNTISGRFHYLQDLEKENAGLKLKIATLEMLQEQIVKTESENLELRKFLNLAKTIKHNFISAKIISSVITPFTRSITIEAGSINGININDIVRGKAGLVGRVLEVSDNYSVVMLIEDHNSRIPVITATSKEKGILARENKHLKMVYLQEGHKIQVGEIIYSSGDGKIYPKGIPVAIVTEIINDGVFVKSIEELNHLEFVIVETASSS